MSDWLYAADRSPSESMRYVFKLKMFAIGDDVTIKLDRRQQLGNSRHLPSKCYPTVT